MSGHDPCDKAIRLLWRFIDHEMDETTYRELHTHLVECEPCGRRAAFESKLQEIIRMKCGQERAPEAFRQRLIQILREF